MSSLTDPWLSTAPGQNHASVMESDVSDQRKAVVRHRLIKRPEEIAPLDTGFPVSADVAPQAAVRRVFCQRDQLRLVSGLPDASAEGFSQAGRVTVGPSPSPDAKNFFTWDSCSLRGRLMELSSKVNRGSSNCGKSTVCSTWRAP